MMGSGGSFVPSKDCLALQALQQRLHMQLRAVRWCHLQTVHPVAMCAGRTAPCMQLIAACCHHCPRLEPERLCLRLQGHTLRHVPPAQGAQDALGCPRFYKCRRQRLCVEAWHRFGPLHKVLRRYRRAYGRMDGCRWTLAMLLLRKQGCGPLLAGCTTRKTALISVLAIQTRKASK